MRQRQHAFDAAVDLGKQEVGVVPEHAAQDLLPAGAVKEGGLGAAEDERVPARAPARLAGRSRWMSMPRCLQCPGLPAARSGTSWSMRPQLKSPSRLLQAPLHAVDVHVVPKACLAVDAVDARLLGVDLPGVEIEDGRLAVGAH